MARKSVRERTATEGISRGPGPQRGRRMVWGCITRGGQINTLMPKEYLLRDPEYHPKGPSATPRNLRPKAYPTHTWLKTIRQDIPSSSASQKILPPMILAMARTLILLVTGVQICSLSIFCGLLVNFKPGNVYSLKVPFDSEWSPLQCSPESISYPKKTRTQALSTPCVEAVDYLRHTIQYLTTAPPRNYGYKDPSCNDIAIQHIPRITRLEPPFHRPEDISIPSIRTSPRPSPAFANPTSTSAVFSCPPGAKNRKTFLLHQFSLPNPRSQKVSH